MRDWKPTTQAVVLGSAIGLIFGGVNLLFTWLAPLTDDTPGALLRFYGPMFLLWAVASYRAARRTGRLSSGLVAGLVISCATFAALEIVILIRVNLFLDELTSRADWRGMMLRFRASGLDSLRWFVNLDYLKGAPFKLAVACVIGLGMGTGGGIVGRVMHSRVRRIVAAA
jgi:hypothetical protein